MTTAGVQIVQAYPTVGSLIAEARQQLLAVGIESAGQEAVWLIEHALGLSGLKQVVARNQELSPGEVARVQALLARRSAREPLQYLLGTQEFCGLEFEVNPSVLIPRPETELLVRETLRRLLPEQRPILVDVGTGSGCLAVALARMIPHGRVLAIDLSTAALETARRNAERHGVASDVSWLHGDLLAPLEGLGLDRQVSVIVSNPPYIASSDWPVLQPEVRLFEPRTALVAGPRGTELHERLLHEAIPFLEPGGVLTMELGQGQGRCLVEMASANSAYQEIQTIRDGAGIERVLVAQRVG